MWKRSGGPSAAASALQRASSQLRGERPASRNVDDEDDIGAYLSNLSRQTVKPTSTPNWDKFDELSDISLSSDDLAAASPKKSTVGAGSKFLKKKKPEDVAASGTKSQAASSIKGPSTSAAGPQKSKSSKPGLQLGGSKTSSALSKAASFTSKLTSKPQKEAVKLSDSDLDLDMSMDEDVMKDIQQLKPTPAPVKSVGKTVKNEAPDYSFRSGAPKFASVSNLYGDISDDDSASIGKGGSKFLKKKKTEPEIVEEKRGPSPKLSKKKATSEGAKKKDMFSLKSSEKYGTTVKLDSDEESLQNYIDCLSSSSGASKTPRTPRTPRVKSPPSARKGQPLLLDQDPVAIHDISEEEGSASSPGDNVSREESISEPISSVEEDFRLNVMDLDALEVSPTKPKPSKTTAKKSEKAPVKTKSSSDKKKKDIFSSLGLQTVDDLLDSPEEEIDLDLGSEISEVATEADSDGIGEVIGDMNDLESITASGRSIPLRSILSPSPRPQTPKSGRGRVRLALDNVLEVEPRSPSPEVISTARKSGTEDKYTADFESESEAAPSVKTEGDTDEEIATELTASHSHGRQRKKSESDYYSDDFNSATESVATTSRRYSRTSSRESYTDSYTSYEDDYTRSSSRTPSPEPKVKPKAKKKVSTRTSEVQTGAELGLNYQWNPELSYARLGAQYGMGYVDPTPIATHTISPEALEAMTGYSPSVLAMNDMLRQQLQLTRNFIASQQYMYEAYVGSMDMNHSYTTLEETKEYIKTHAKPKLTFEEALKQVKEEMGMEDSGH